MREKKARLSRRTALFSSFEMKMVMMICNGNPCHQSKRGSELPIAVDAINTTFWSTKKLAHLCTSHGRRDNNIGLWSVLYFPTLLN